MQEEKSAIEEKEKKTKKDQLRLREIEEEMKPLEQFLDDAKLQRAAIKAEIGTMSEIPSDWAFCYLVSFPHFRDRLLTS